MTPDRVTRLLGVLKDVHQLAWDGIEQMAPKEKFTLDLAKQTWESIEAELSAESAGDRHDSWIGNLDPLKEPASPHSEATADLLKRMDKLERFTLAVSVDGDGLHHGCAVQRRRGEWVRFEQVKTIVGQWVVEQRGK